MPYTRALWALLAVVVAIRFAEPILDGDPFFHMAYARQMLERGTLVLDHAAFSWTPASTDVIYCAWIAQLVLFGLWTLAGPWGLFVLRYAIVAGVVALVVRFAWRSGLVGAPTTPAACVVLVLLSVAATVIKPELFSLLLFHAAVAGYFHARLAALEGRPPTRMLMAWPAVLVLWANVHGAFMFAAPLVVGAVVGDALNARFSPAFALPPLGRRQLHWAAALSGLAVLVTPYGIAYPVQLIRTFPLRDPHRAQAQPGGVLRKASGGGAREGVAPREAAGVASPPVTSATSRFGARADHAAGGIWAGRGLVRAPRRHDADDA